MKAVNVQRGDPKPKLPLVLGVIGAVLLLLVIGVEGMHAMTKNPEFCVSCHPMQVAFETWSHSSHREVADCNSCHLDQRNYFTATYSKAATGAKHLYNFVAGNIPARIRIASGDAQITRQNCLRCHGDIAQSLLMDQERNCSDCHRYTPHGNIR